MKKTNYREWQKPNPKRDKYIYKLRTTTDFSFPKIAEEVFKKFKSVINADRARQIFEREKKAVDK